MTKRTVCGAGLELVLYKWCVGKTEAWLSVFVSYLLHGRSPSSMSYMRPPPTCWRKKEMCREPSMCCYRSSTRSRLPADKSYDRRLRKKAATLAHTAALSCLFSALDKILKEDFISQTADWRMSLNWTNEQVLSWYINSKAWFLKTAEVKVT